MPKKPTTKLLTIAIGLFASAAALVCVHDIPMAICTAAVGLGFLLIRDSML